MTDAPPPSIPPSIPPRGRPSSSTGTRTVTAVPGRGDGRSNGTTSTPARRTSGVSADGQAPSPRREPAQAAGREPAAREPEQRHPAEAPFPAVDAPVDELDEAPSPLAVAVEQTGHWLKKAAGATGASMSAAYSSLTRPRPKDDPMTANPTVTSAPPRTIPPTAPATTGGAPTVRTVTGRTPAVGSGPRRVRLAVSRVDPWSVMKLAFLLSFAAGIVLVVAVSVLWLTLDGLHVFTSIDNLVTQIVGTESQINILQYVEFTKVLSVATLVAVIDVFLLTALATIGAFLYNVVAALVGGVHVTMTDE